VNRPQPPPSAAPSRPSAPRLRDGLVEDLRKRIESGALPPGSALHSVRRFAALQQVSAFTAAEVYNVLTASGLVEARRGLGYFVAGAAAAAPRPAPGAPADALWERRVEARSGRIRIDAGGGWLPSAWQYGDGLAAALRAVARQRGTTEGYGAPHGYEPLRQHFATQLRARGLGVQSEQIVLTQGASQAIDLVVRTLIEPGDTVAVEDPGYPPTLELLRARGVRLLPIPRHHDGPDLDVLVDALKSHPISAIFTNTTLQNPTGTTTSPPVGRRLLELAEQHGFLVVEDDIFSDLSPTPQLPIATLDQCRRVVYISSVSKSISPTLRVGFLVAPSEVAPRLVRSKTLSALASSELSERIVLEVLTQPHYRRHLEALRRRLQQAQTRVQSALLAQGVELAFRPAGGMFLWGRLPSQDTVGKLWRDAVGAGILLAPGELFRPDGRATPYWRFNVAHCDDDSLAAFIEALNPPH
jgi:hypothetical protein